MSIVLMKRMRNHSYPLPDRELEKGTDHHEVTNGVEEVVEGGNRVGSPQGCRTGVMVPRVVNKVAVREATVEAVEVVGEEDMEIKVEEVDMAVMSETMDLRVKVDGNHDVEMMDPHRLGDPDQGVRRGESVIDQHHHYDADLLVRHPDDVMLLQLDEGNHHLEDDVRKIHHLDEPLLLEDVETTTPHLGAGTTRLLLERGETTRPLLEVKPKKTIHPQEDVVMIHHLVESGMHLDQGQGRDHLPSLHLVDVAGALVEAGAEQGPLHLKVDGEGVRHRLSLEQRPRMTRWIRRMAMDQAMWTLR